ncbi:hypothetical protein EYA82_05520 [Burkholderia pseudomallei]|nr:hypothetical protein EYA82_05520 [Burkholderia pseudomallei]
MALGRRDGTADGRRFDARIMKGRRRRRGVGRCAAAQCSAARRAAFGGSASPAARSTRRRAGASQPAGRPKRPFVFVQYGDGGRRDGADPAGMERRAARDRHDRAVGRIGAGRDAIVAALREISAV